MLQRRSMSWNSLHHSNFVLGEASRKWCSLYVLFVRKANSRRRQQSLGRNWGMLHKIKTLRYGEFLFCERSVAYAFFFFAAGFFFAATFFFATFFFAAIVVEVSAYKNECFDLKASNGCECSWKKFFASNEHSYYYYLSLFIHTQYIYKLRCG